MNRREKCRCVSSVLVWLIGVAGVVSMIYGGVHLYRVSKQTAAQDGLDTLLAPFVKCSDFADEIPDGAWSTSTVAHAVMRRCAGNQLGVRLIMGFSAGFMILALLTVKCAFKKDKWFGFTMWSTLAIASIVVAVTVVGLATFPVASQFVDCKHYDYATAQELGQLGFTCVKTDPTFGTPDKMSALKWLCKLGMFFGGSAASVASLLMFFMIKSCCCCNPNASCCAGQACSTPVNGEHPCRIRRAIHKFRARFCRRAQADQDVMPVSAPSYYEVNAAEGEAASEDAGASSPSNQYYGVN